MDTNTLVMQLKIARDFYYKGKPIMTDNEFDILETKLRELDPTNDYFTTVGTTNERGTKVKHTIPMGSLNQVDTARQIRDWLGSYSDEIICTHKLDGNSIAITYDEDGEFKSAATRGDGIEGLDITRHIRRMLNSENPPIPAKIETNKELYVRCEAIFSKTLFGQHVTGYKNPRNYVAGQLNRSIADQTFIDHVNLVAFDADIVGSKQEILDSLKRLGFEVVQSFAVDFTTADDALLEAKLAEIKDQSDYELDGIVIDMDNLTYRQRLGFDHLNPNFAVKFKINVNFVDTEVIDVIWRPSKDGYLKPRVQFEPIDLAGVTISFATGFNAKFILDNKIGKGAVVNITRSGEVIPYIQKVITPAESAMMPEDYDSKCYWTDTGVDLVLKEKPDESVIKEIVDFFTGIGAPHLKIGNVTALFEAGFSSIEEIIKMSEEEMVVVLGENGYKAYSGLRERLIGIDEYILAGSLPFFGRGVGKRKMKVLAETYGDLTKLTYNHIIDTPGFEEITAVKITNAIPLYNHFLEDMIDYISVKKYERVSGDLNGIAVCFTGVRSKDLEAIIESRGGKVLSSAGKQMTHLVAKDPNGKSGKLDKARKAGVTIISLEEAQQLWDTNV